MRIQAADQQITSNAGVLLLREAESRLGIVNSITNEMSDPRHPTALGTPLRKVIRERKIRVFSAAHRK